jgi:hypothetical protein
MNSQLTPAAADVLARLTNPRAAWQLAHHVTIGWYLTHPATSEQIPVAGAVVAELRDHGYITARGEFTVAGSEFMRQGGLD